MSVPSRRAKKGQQRSDETVKCRFFTESTLEKLDNCLLPGFDCFAREVRKEQTDTLVFVALGQNSLPSKLDETFR